MDESNTEAPRADAGTSMNPAQLRAHAELTLIERYGLPPHLLAADGLLGSLVEELRYLAGRHARLAQRFSIAAVGVAEQAGRVIDAAVQTGTFPAQRPALDPHDVTAVAEVGGRMRELHELLSRRVPVVVKAAEAAGYTAAEPVAADAVSHPAGVDHFPARG